jgi:hypothetical protein
VDELMVLTIAPTAAAVVQYCRVHLSARSDDWLAERLAAYRTGDICGRVRRYAPAG